MPATKTEKLPPTTDPQGRCGTYPGARAHRRRRESLCDPCREQERAYVRERQRLRREDPEKRAHDREQERDGRLAAYHRNMEDPAYRARTQERDRERYWRTNHPEDPEGARAAYEAATQERERQAKAKRDWAEFLTTPAGVTYLEDQATYREDRKRETQRAKWRRQAQKRYERAKVDLEYQAKVKARRKRYKAKAYQTPGSSLRTRRIARRNRERLGGKVAGIPTTATLQDRLDYYGGRCWICGTDTAVVGLHWDHVKPIAEGGADALCNLRPTCPPCNQAKSDTWPYTPPGGPHGQ